MASIYIITRTTTLPDLTSTLTLIIIISKGDEGERVKWVRRGTGGDKKFHIILRDYLIRDGRDGW